MIILHVLVHTFHLVLVHGMDVMVRIILVTVLVLIELLVRVLYHALVIVLVDLVLLRPAVLGQLLSLSLSLVYLLAHDVIIGYVTQTLQVMML